jgi:hypothetical protein
MGSLPSSQGAGLARRTNIHISLTTDYSFRHKKPPTSSNSLGSDITAALDSSSVLPFAPPVDL